MPTLLIIIPVIAIVLAILCVAYKKADWKNHDKDNRQYYNEDGDHVYYDRKLIRWKQEKEKRK